jgi:acyl-homoserine lactone acylase PvdQ
VASDDPEVRRFQETLAAWDLRTDVASTPAALAEAFRVELIRAVFADRLSPATFEHYLWAGAGVHQVALERLFADPDARFFGPEPAAPLAARGSPLEPVLGRLLNLGPVEAPGGVFTVWAGAWRPDAPFRLVLAPLYRQVVDLGDLRRSRWQPPVPGQSEHPLLAPLRRSDRPLARGPSAAHALAPERRRGGRGSDARPATALSRMRGLCSGPRVRTLTGP